MSFTMSHDEILDLVSLQDEVIGQEKRSIVYERKLSNFRVINGFICNSAKQLWIPRRHKNKKLFPLHLDASVGGHVAAGESYHDAFVRETQEELNLDVRQCIYSPIAHLTPHEHQTSAFMWVYLIKSDIVPPYNTDDFVEYFWLTPDEFFDKLAQGDKAKGDMLSIVPVLKMLLTQ
ncbi:MAG: NUDIX hydrolase [Candidatus Babeliales bacterium]|jgi:isopentenyl-diphosphate delta-isomerase